MIFLKFENWPNIFKFMLSCESYISSLDMDRGLLQDWYESYEDVENLVYGAEPPSREDTSSIQCKARIREYLQKSRSQELVKVLSPILFDNEITLYRRLLVDNFSRIEKESIGECWTLDLEKTKILMTSESNDQYHVLKAKFNYDDIDWSESLYYLYHHCFHDEMEIRPFGHIEKDIEILSPGGESIGYIRGRIGYRNLL